MKIDRQILLNALEKVKPGLANHEMLAQTTSFAFMKDKVVTYNDEISISYPIKNLNITGAIKAEKLYKLLTKLNDETIELEIKNAEILLSGKHTKAGFVKQAKITLPTIQTDNLDWKKLPTDFLEGITFCLFSCSKDMSKPILTCLHITKKGIIESTDNYRLSWWGLEDFTDIPSFLLPVSAAEKLIKYNITEIASGEGWIHFKTDEGCIFSARTYEGTFPNIAQIIDSFKNQEAKKIFLPKELLNILERAMIFSKQELTAAADTTNFTFEKKILQIQAKSEEGWFKEKIAVDYNDTKFTFSINATYLKDICTKINNFEVLPNMVRFKGNNWLHIIALIKVQSNDA